MLNFFESFTKGKEAPKLSGVTLTSPFSVNYSISSNTLYDFYRNDPVIMAVVNRIKSDVGSFGIEVRDGKKAADTAVLESLIGYDGRKKTLKKFLERLVRDVEVTGNGYVYLARDGNRVVWIRNVDPRYVVPVVKPTGELLGYVQNLNGIRVFLPEDMFHFKDDDGIDDETLGQSKMVPLYVDLETDKEARESNLAFFKNNQTPSSIVVLDPEFDVEGDENTLSNLERIKTLFESGKHVGGKNHFRTSVISGVKEVIKLQDKITDGQFFGIRRQSLAMACSVYSVPPDLIGITDNSNRSVGDVQLDVYLETVAAKEEAYSQFLTSIAKEALGDSFSVEILQDSLRQLKKKSEIAEKLYEAGIVTTNEAREIVQYEPLADGDKVKETKNVSQKSGGE